MFQGGAHGDERKEGKEEKNDDRVERKRVGSEGDEDIHLFRLHGSPLLAHRHPLNLHAGEKREENMGNFMLEYITPRGGAKKGENQKTKYEPPGAKEHPGAHGSVAGKKESEVEDQ